MDEVLRSPEGDLWYHGSPRRWTKFNFEAPKTAGSWSSYLGPHFAATKETAARFANGDLYGQEEAPGQVVTSRLHVVNSYRFDDEVMMNLHALWVCLQSSLLDEVAVLRRWGEHGEDALDLFLGALVALPSWQQTEELSAMLPSGLEPLDLLYAGDLQGVYVANAVRTDLRRRGYDGIVYSNSLESDWDPDECAVVWEEDQVEVIAIEVPSPFSEVAI